MDPSRFTRFNRTVAMVGMAVVCLVLTSGDGPIAGIQGSGFAQRTKASGPVTKFGSVYVNGIEYDTTGAQISVDGEPASESRLRVGQIVAVNALQNEEGTAGAAEEITYVSDVLGPIAQVDLQGGTIVVLGQKIKLLGDTLMDPALPLGGILGLVPGINVQVSGYPNSLGDLVATRIDLVLSSPGSARLRGVVSSLDTTARTFRVSSQTVDYSAATLAGPITNGDTVVVAGTIQSATSVLRATQVQEQSGMGGAEGERGEIRGLITALSSASNFKIGMQQIVTDGATQFVLHGQTLGPNLNVTVKGVFDTAGAIVASRVEATASGLVGVLGAVESVVGNTVKVLGVTFEISGATSFADNSSQSVRQFAVSDLRAGDYVEIRGRSPQAGSPIQATVVERDDPATKAYVEGKPLQLLAPNLTVLGVPVLTTSQTRFPTTGLLASLLFFLEAPGNTVRVQGTQSGNTVVAERIDYVK
jgi:hypothetical protein